ncbi:MAG TPA: PDZ domain-containing protein [Candidatus Acidoferrales bacterium]|nr:PDZ domain-containing protein [Candidatus Acidoferrales bacterium]
MRRSTSRGWLHLAAIATVASTIMLLAGAASARPWLGVYTQSLTGELRDGMGLHDGDGVIIDRVVDGSPADRAGLRKGDVIERFNARHVTAPDDLARLVGNARHDQEVSLSILRDGQERSIDVTLAERPTDEDEMAPPSAPDAPEAPETPETPEAPSAPRAPHAMKFKIVTPDGDSDGQTHVYRMDGDSPDGQGTHDWAQQLPNLGNLGNLGNMRFLGMGRTRLGVRIESLNDDLASALGAPDHDGVLVVGVMKDTPAERAGLRAGDVIRSVDDHSVTDAEGLVRAIADAGESASLGVWRKGERRTVEAKLDAAPRVRRDGGSGDNAPAPNWTGKRVRDRDSSGDDQDLRQQLQDLKDQLRELKQELEDHKHD